MMVGLEWAFRTARDQTLTLVADVSEADMSRQSIKGERHPAWILGHILLADIYLLSLLGHRQLSQDFEQLVSAHGPGAVPDSNGRYQTKASLVERLQEAGETRLKAVAGLRDSDFARELPDPNLARVQPTIGHHLHALVFHEGYHCGQLSAWRKAHGLPAKPWLLGPGAVGAA